MYKFYCPACKEEHWFASGPNSYWRPMWRFNGDMEKPTVAPSILVHRDEGGKERRCHLYLSGGRIQFLDDCTHKMSGQIVDMVDFPEDGE